MKNKRTADFLNYSIGQIGYVVEDLYKTVKNYHENFGVGNWQIYTYGPPLLKFMNYMGKPVRYKSRIALSYFGNTRIEIIQNLEGKTVYSDFIEKHGYGIQHLGIYVEDIKEEIRKAEEAGFSVLMEGGGFGPDGDGHFAYLDTEKDHGITFELIQRPLRRYEPEDIYPAE